MNYRLPNVPHGRNLCGCSPVSSQAQDGVDFTNESIRRSFIRKLFATLTVQWILTVGVIQICTYAIDVKKIAKEHSELHMYITLLILPLVGIGILTAAYCSECARRKPPMNYIILGLFTLTYSLLLGNLCGLMPPTDVMLAVGGTSAACLALTLFAFQTTIDLTARNQLIFVLLWCLIFFAAFVPFFRGKHLELMYVSLSTVFSCLYFVYDTQMIIGGNRNYGFYPGDYVFAALTIYIDILVIFLDILNLVGITNRRKNNNVNRMNS